VTATAKRQTGQKNARGPTSSANDEPIFYPYSDGEPMGESQPHIEAIRAMLDALDDLYWNDDNVSVHGNMHWYWCKGDVTQTRAPDAMVIPGVPMDHDRTSFKSWDHGGAVPAAIIETASYKTYRANLGEVREDYEVNGVREYFIFDAARLYLKVPLMGFRLSRRRYRDVPVETDGSMVSRELNVRLLPEGRFLRLIDLRTGERIPSRPERLAFYQARLAEHEAHMAEQEARLTAQAAELKRIQELLRKHGIDPDATK
jgi:Uma2 family endonuclease